MTEPLDAWAVHDNRTLTTDKIQIEQGEHLIQMAQCLAKKQFPLAGGS